MVPNLGTAATLARTQSGVYPCAAPAFGGINGEYEYSGGNIMFSERHLDNPHAVLSETSPGEYKVEINKKVFGFYQPYLSQESISIQDDSKFTLAIMDLGHANNWIVCEKVEGKVGTDVGIAEVIVLKKVGVIRTDTCGELLVGGKLGSSLLQKMNCSFK